MNNPTFYRLIPLLLLMFCQLSHGDGLWRGEADELGNSRVVTASKSSQDKLDSVLSISSIDRQQIVAAGASNIAEALQLLPGIFVTQQTNGLYDVNIRGLNFVPEETTISGMSNRRTLLMIDGRPVYDYFNSQTLLENLPVGLADIARIEVVRGAVSALYGPNAVSGVINLITRRSHGKGVEFDVQQGNHSSSNYQFAAWHEFSGQQLRLSASMEDRERSQSDYYSYTDKAYVPISDLAGLDGIDEIADPQRSLEADHFMLSLNNANSEYFYYDLSYFHTESYHQAMRLNSRITPLTASTLLSDELNLKVDTFGLQMRLSQQKSFKANLGFDDFVYHSLSQQVEIEYPIRLPRLLIRPGVFNNRNEYNGQFIQGKQQLLHSGITLRTEYQLQRDTRMVAGARYTNYNAPDDGYLDYQLSFGWQPFVDTKMHLGVMSSHNSPSMVGQYIDVDFVSNDNSFRALVIGDPQARLQRTTNYELGLHHSLDLNSTLSMEVFVNELSEFSGYVVDSSIQGGSTLVVERAYQDIQTAAVQQGLTFEWLYEAGRWDFSLQGTVQKTRISDQPETLNAPLVYDDVDGQGTPGFYAGYVLNYQLADAWQLNLNGNYLSAYRFNAQQPQGDYQRPAGGFHNITLSYRAHDQWLMQVSARNLSDQHEPQAFNGDDFASQLWGRLTFRY
jgi:iron complex outermembrane receptor protein